MRGMARSAFDPAAAGWEKATYQRGDILDRGHLAELFDGADVAVHLAFAIFGDREETPADQPRGQPQRLRSGGRGRGRAARLRLLGRRLRLPPREPAAADRGRCRRAAASGFYYSAQKAELEAALDEILAGSELDAYVFRPCIVAGPRATMLIEQTVGAARLGDPAPRLRRASSGGCRCSRPILPDAGVPLQLVHHDDVARRWPPRSRARASPAPTTSPARGRSASPTSPARSAGARSASPARRSASAPPVAGRLSFISPQLEWATALPTPVMMDTRRPARSSAGSPASTPPRP